MPGSLRTNSDVQKEKKCEHAERRILKVLIIAHAFPPTGGPAVQRTSKFAKYLPQAGWLPLILTIDERASRYRRDRDVSLLEEFPSDGRIYRTRSLEPHRVYTRFLNWQRQRRSEDHAKQDALASRDGRLGKVFAHSFRMLKDLWWACFCIPDAHIGWLPFALLKGLVVTRSEEVDLIYSTSDPLTDHLIGYLLSRVSGRPWVADFRDPWTQDVTYRDVGRLRKKVDEVLEFLFLSRADRVVVVSRSMGENLIDKYPTIASNKVVTITNGYDEDDFCAPVSSSQRPDKLTIAYAGRFNAHKQRSPAFLHALRAVLDHHPELEDKLEARFAGVFGEENECLVRQLRLGDVVKPLGYLPHRDSIEELLRADSLLLTIKAEEGAEVLVSGKLFEYLAARKPILALVPEGEAARLVENTGAGIVVPPDDVEAIKEAIYRLYCQHEAGSLRLQHSQMTNQFTRENLTVTLAALFSQLVEARA
jgi:glycosyltransferase involved in cell wall biosynthesis